MKIILLFTALSIAADGWAETSAHNSLSTLCDAKNEQVIFSCPINGSHKILSVCESLSTNIDAYVEYRFGRKKKIELSYQASKKFPYHQIFFNQTELQVGQHDTIFFQNKKTGYRLSINSNNQTLQKSAAVSIYEIDKEGYKSEKEQLSFKCDSPVQENVINKLQKTPYLIFQTAEQLNDWVGD